MNEKWIWLDTAAEADVYGEFKTDFVWSGEKTVLEISADSEYAVFVNGEFVYGGQYADFPWYKIYDEIDITDYLRTGENECLIWVWHCGDENFCHYIHRPAVRFSIVSGGQVCVESGNNTLCRHIPHYLNGVKKHITTQIGYTFSVDLSKSTEAYKTAVVLEDMVANMKKRPISLLRRLPEVKAKKISKNVYDLGAETVGFPFVTLKAKKGKTVRISFGEWLDNGRVPRLIGGRDFSFTIVGDGTTKRVFNPLRKLGCRYFGIDGEAEIEEIGLLPLVYPFDEYEVAIDEHLRRKIYDVSVQTLKLNAMEHYYDCPWREQGFYALDSRLQMRYGYQAFKTYEYQYAALKLMSEDRNGEGMISITVPTSHKLVIPSFALFYIVAMEEYATATGDTRLIEEYFGKMQSVLGVFAQNITSGLVGCFKGENFWNFYEWNNGLDGATAETDAAINLTFLLSLGSFMKICDMLGKTTEKENYLALYEKVAKETDHRYYDTEKGLYRMTEQDDRFFALVNAYAVLTGVADKKKAAFICEKLTGNELVDCTLSMLPFKYDALLYVNEEKYKEYVLADIDKNYAYMLENGATSFWETLRGAADFDGAGSLCHGWAAAPIAYYHQLGVVKSKR